MAGQAAMVNEMVIAPMISSTIPAMLASRRWNKKSPVWAVVRGSNV
jgi:hypothetical protein